MSSPLGEGASLHSVNDVEQAMLRFLQAMDELIAVYPMQKEEDRQQEVFYLHAHLHHMLQLQKLLLQKKKTCRYFVENSSTPLFSAGSQGVQPDFKKVIRSIKTSILLKHYPLEEKRKLFSVLDDLLVHHTYERRIRLLKDEGVQSPSRPLMYIQTFQ
ncbi:hypothetical protein B0H94_11456 [Salsuginibacillus halophilus]|uniref:Uncharacterized protein n=1 Tax=Salsuginibacillus halophilus TaxID=517424 RepID=A0A2P8H8N8_9BACI|nr:hypothetical protein [Salsuginibacillus halophilus]PSL42582.1 hypothetical protein B0H94_11456 [Salsuginibacillus halophilus]